MEDFDRSLGVRVQTRHGSKPRDRDRSQIKANMLGFGRELYLVQTLAEKIFDSTKFSNFVDTDLEGYPVLQTENEDKENEKADLKLNRKKETSGNYGAPQLKTDDSSFPLFHVST